MLGKIIMWAVSFGCAILFFCIGVYAKKIEKPMWFWSGSEIDAAQITDVKQYNKENGIMWQIYSLWYFAAGISEIKSSLLALIFIILGNTIGIALLVISYKKIYEKYKVR